MLVTSTRFFLNEFRGLGVTYIRPRQISEQSTHGHILESSTHHRRDDAAGSGKGSGYFFAPLPSHRAGRH